MSRSIWVTYQNCCGFEFLGSFWTEEEAEAFATKAVSELVIHVSEVRLPDGENPLEMRCKELVATVQHLAREFGDGLRENNALKAALAQCRDALRPLQSEYTTSKGDPIPCSITCAYAAAVEALGE